MTNVAPSQLFPGYVALAAGDAAPADCIAIPLTALPGLSPAEADENTGSAPKLVYEFLRAATDNNNTLATTARSSRMTLSRSTPQGAGNNLVSVGHTATVQLDVSGADVAAE